MLPGGHRPFRKTMVRLSTVKRFHVNREQVIFWLFFYYIYLYIYKSAKVNKGTKTVYRIKWKTNTFLGKRLNRFLKC